MVRRVVLLIGIAVFACGCSALSRANTTSRIGKSDRSINISTYTPGDQFMNSVPLQAKIKAHGTPFLRMSFRDGWTDGQYLTLLGAIKRAGATPVVIVHGACGGSSSDQHWLSLVDSVFPTRYWVEYGNEEDLSCAANASTYVAGWNADVPRLKAAHPRASFIGPVTMDYKGTYIETFMQRAVPRPDAVSWHEYVCSAQQTDAYCLEHIARWANHAVDMRSRMSAVGYRVPVWITEWNLDPQADVRYNTPFVQVWTASALDEWARLEQNGLVNVTMIYTMTDHGNFGLVSGDGSFTPQGLMFFR
ncbi:MAG: hypothetical protein JOZ99_00290 [Actinobacteria bacterium]|nr:hypothetical protein [Actinomycetota bacterium]